ncbi:MAG: DNA polymerase III subunit gamma/tau [Gemmatimonadetes bacterium]|nr:DNA polymerase III subunit gamma/tau [Gemmatimonadota bacterium]
MSHTALARKYRPRRFSELIGQEHVAAGLAGAVARNRVAHAYLLTGPRGVGKTTAARILAMALNCERRRDADGGEPCGTCDSCTRIWSGAANLDVVEIDAASNRGVDDARDLRERAMYAPSGPERSKVYIVDEAHMLTREAWNALLKILEEPPPRVVFVFATTEPQKIQYTAAPVLSRMQRFDFRRLGPQAIAGRLREVAAAETLAVDDDALQLMARVAAGGMRDALSLLDQAVAFGEGAVTAATVRDALGLIADELYAEVLDVVAARRSADVLPFVARLVEAGADLTEFVAGLGEAVRALLLRVLGGDTEGLTEVVRAAVERHARVYRPGDLLRMLKLLAETETAIRRSANARLYVETLLLQWTLLDRTVELEEVLEALGRPGVQGSPVERGSRAGQRGPSGEEREQNPLASQPRAASPASAPQSPAAPTGADRPDRFDGPAPPDRTPPASGLTEESLSAWWPAVVDAVGQRRRMLREALARVTPMLDADNTVVLEFPEGDVHREGVEQSRGTVEGAISQVMGVVARLVVRGVASGTRPGRGGAAAGESDAPVPDTKRLDRRGDREERLRVYRAKDPALDAAVDAFDLELSE